MGAVVRVPHVNDAWEIGEHLDNVLGSEGAFVGLVGPLGLRRDARGARLVVAAKSKD